jgi:pimeloyl-ACP methyl ester carboxylesterase
MNQVNKISQNYIVLVIGGFVLNNMPIAALTELSTRVNFIDINGFAAPFTLDDITRTVEEIIYSYKEPVILVGYSTGGLVAIRLTTQIPNLVNKIILINSTPCFISQDNWQGISVDNFSRLTKKLHNLPLEQFKHHFSCLAFYPDVYKQLSQWQSNLCTKENLANWLDIILTTDLRQELAEISKECLAIYAINDHLVPNTNHLDNQFFTKSTLDDSSHASLNLSTLVNQIKGFIYEE